MTLNLQIIYLNVCGYKCGYNILHIHLQIIYLQLMIDVSKLFMIRRSDGVMIGRSEEL